MSLTIIVLSVVLRSSSAGSSGSPGAISARRLGKPQCCGTTTLRHSGVFLLGRLSRFSSCLSEGACRSPSSLLRLLLRTVLRRSQSMRVSQKPSMEVKEFLPQARATFSGPQRVLRLKDKCDCLSECCSMPWGFEVPELPL